VAAVPTLKPDPIQKIVMSIINSAVANQWCPGASRSSLSNHLLTTPGQSRPICQGKIHQAKPPKNLKSLGKPCKNTSKNPVKIHAIFALNQAIHPRALPTPCRAKAIGEGGYVLASRPECLYSEPLEN
jgi:hypothetical protein